MRNITRRVAEFSRTLVWDHGILPKDALHVATAIDAKLSLLNTFDVKLINKCKGGAVFGLKVEKPRVDEPQLDLEQPNGKEA